MPPKKENKKQTQQRQKKAIEDKTFGLKNKNKSKKVGGRWWIACAALRALARAPRHAALSLTPARPRGSCVARSTGPAVRAEYRAHGEDGRCSALRAIGRRADATRSRSSRRARTLASSLLSSRRARHASWPSRPMCVSGAVARALSRVLSSAHSHAVAQEMMKQELGSLFKAVADVKVQKVSDNVDPKTVLCAFFKVRKQSRRIGRPPASAHEASHRPALASAAPNASSLTISAWTAKSPSSTCTLIHAKPVSCFPEAHA